VSDVGSILLQAAGGGVAALADNKVDKVNAESNILIMGIASQAETMGIVGFCLWGSILAIGLHGLRSR
jgi:hypothetical protein